MALVPKDSEQYDFLTRDVEGNQMIMREIVLARDIQYARKQYIKYQERKWERELDQIEESIEPEDSPPIDELVAKTGKLKTPLLRRNGR